MNMVILMKRFIQMLKKLEKVRKKAGNILEVTDVSEKEKMNQVKS